MENAGRGAADVLCRLLARSRRNTAAGPPRIVICCGKGNNAGDGFVMARHLDLRGHRVGVLVWAEPDELQGDAGVNFRIIRQAGLTLELFGRNHAADRLAGYLSDATWIVDALLGTELRGEPRPPLDAVINQLNAAAARKLAIDLPSGLDCDTGEPARHTIRARHTCAFRGGQAWFPCPCRQAVPRPRSRVGHRCARRLIDEILAASGK